MEHDPFPEEELLVRAAEGDSDALCTLDSMGFLLKEGEDAPGYVERIRSMHRRYLLFLENTADGKEYEVYPGIRIREDARIPASIMEEAAEATKRRYGFSIHWAPGYFLSRGLGPLWGGCALSDDAPDSVPVFLIRKNFRSSRKFFIYSRDELLSHELCHAARAPLMDRMLEEHFAYAVSHSALRRYMGNCFQTDRDALLFLGPVLLLLLVQILVQFAGWPLPVWPFWILALAWPVYLLLRNAVQRKIYFRAEENLRELGFRRPYAALFRCTSPEIREFSKIRGEKLAEKLADTAQNSLRMKIILTRFQQEKGDPNHADDQRSERLSERNTESGCLPE